MSRSQELAARYAALNDEIATFVRHCSPDVWRTATADEAWPLGVVARHIAAGHFATWAWAKMIVDGQPLPPLTGDDINQGNAHHAQKHGDCTQEEVLELLASNKAVVVEFLEGLSDADLDRTAHLALAGGDISTQQFVESIVIGLGVQHFASMKATAG